MAQDQFCSNVQGRLDARTGPCGGYVIDHVVPLACGGADAPSNMQWQTVVEAKVKDRWERQGCATR